MEIILLIIVMILIPVAIDLAQKGEATSEVWVKTGVIVALFILSLIVPTFVNDTKATIREDVLEYQKITYDSPQTIREVRTTYPFWSVRADLVTYTIEEQK